MDFRIPFVFMLLIATATSLECYQCNSHQHHQCGDSIAARESMKQFIVTCNETQSLDENAPNPNIVAPFCHKIKMYIDGRESEVRVLRECSTARRPTANNETCYKVLGEEYEVVACQCDEDLCNGAARRTLHSGALLLAVAAVVFRSLNSMA
ncbi:hypothetical protein FHG87_016235 [Trinorchestia longiramus]|nr:hypothetical protein FHG87_016235 [Trinorchestia longiramus]